MLLQIEVILTIFASFLIGIYTQVNPSCRQIDFNETSSILEFEECGNSNNLVINSYNDVSFEPFRGDAIYFLSNGVIGPSCLRTASFFRVNTNTQIDVLIYLNSNIEGDNSYVQINMLDTNDGNAYLMGEVTVSSEWHIFNGGSNIYIDNAKFEIRAFVSAEAFLAIEYLHITNPSIPELYCRRTTTTSTSTTTQKNH